MHVRTKDFIIWHIPKCAGSYIMRLMEVNDIEHELSPRTTKAGNFLEQHLCGDRSGHFIPVEWELTDLPTITFVRHPLTWYRSYWAYWTQRDWPRQDCIFDVRTRSDNFRCFIDNVLREYPGGYLQHVYRHYTEVSDVVGRQETIWQDIRNFLSYYAGIDNLQDAGTVNASETTETYTEQQAEAILQNEYGVVWEYGYNYMPDGIVEGDV